MQGVHQVAPKLINTGLPNKLLNRAGSPVNVTSSKSSAGDPPSGAGFKGSEMHLQIRCHTSPLPTVPRSSVLPENLSPQVCETLLVLAETSLKP